MSNGEQVNRRNDARLCGIVVLAIQDYDLAIGGRAGEKLRIDELPPGSALVFAMCLLDEFLSKESQVLNI